MTQEAPMQPAFSPDEGEGIVHGRPLIVIPTIGGGEKMGWARAHSHSIVEGGFDEMS